MTVLISDVGYMNAYQQRVIARAQTRSDQSPLLVMRCGVCGHHYGSEEDHVVSQQCPRHDAGRTGPSAEPGDVEWLEPATVGRRLSTADRFI
jgi:hypothetical protein